MLVFVRSLSYTPHASFSEESLTLLMLVLVRCFFYTPHADYREDVLKHFVSVLDWWESSLTLRCTPRAGVSYDMRFSYTVVVTTTQK